MTTDRAGDLAHRFDEEQTCAALDPQPAGEQRERIIAAVQAIADRTIFLVHYYQPTWIKRLLRELGVNVVVSDSQALARAGVESDAELLFCVTVPFMAGSSAILARDDQTVLLADPDAGCSLEASAPDDLVLSMFERLEDAGIAFAPVCYTNVGAAAKAVVGQYKGIIHTSSSAIDALRWARERELLPVFLPDQHLAENVAAEAGLSKLAVWQNTRRDGGLDDATLRDAEMVVWTGQCNVHVKTDSAVIERFADDDDEAELILHPEVPNADIRAALDVAGPERVGVGSTRFIRDRLEALCERKPGARVGIATESNFVEELRQEYEGRLTVENLLRNVCACIHMRTRPEGMLAALDVVGSAQRDTRGAAEALRASRHVVTLDPETRELAREALSRSLELEEQPFSLRWS